MSINNYIPISRRLFDHPFWSEAREYSRFEAWLYLLKEARFEDAKKYIGNQVITVKRGQVYASIRFYADAWKWSTKKVLGYFDLLCKDGMIMRETVKETGQTIITICNYEKYNFDVNSKETAKETVRKQQGNSKETKPNKDNNYNNYNNNISPPTPSKGDVAVSKKTWRDDFEMYLTDLREAYNALVIDTAYMTERSKYHPGVNIQLSLEKACKDFWETDEGWKNKKASKTVKINWKQTLTKSLDQRYNLVYKQKNQQNEPTKAVYQIPD